MPKTKPKIVTDKVAGLESHQFSRDEHRFAALPVKNLDIARLPRQPRVGNNSRNNSDGVFQFGGTLNYPDPRERYISEVAQHEKQRLQQKRDKLDERINLKRDWIDGMERERWERMSREYVKEQELWKVKHGRTKLGAHSVNYNPITLAYHDTEGGRRLAEQDAKAMVPPT
nr:hypothetical protein HK105_006193 [Polyrhizophydium stewartii]